MKLLALIKKEFLRFFRDPRLIVTMLLPGLVIYLVYSVMGNFMNPEAEASSYDFKVYRSGESQLTSVIEAYVEEMESTLEWLEVEDAEAAKAAVKAGEATAYLAFSDNFDNHENAYVKIVYSMENDESNTFHALATYVLDLNGRLFEIREEYVEDAADFAMDVMGSLLPFLIVIFIFSACMSVTLESVAGEKERGTLATILVTSARRSDIALGKVIPLSCISMIGAASSFLGVALSMPKLMGLSVSMFGGYSLGSYLLIFLLIMSVTPLIVSAISTVSAWAKSVKEASGYTSIIMIFVMVLSIISTFTSGIGNWGVAVPVLNAVVTIQQILAGAMPVWQAIMSFGANIGYTAVLVFLITKMLSSEKIMFGK